MDGDDDISGALADEEFIQFVKDYEVAVGIIASAAKDLTAGLISEEQADHFGRAVLARLAHNEPPLMVTRMTDDG